MTESPTEIIATVASDRAKSPRLRSLPHPGPFRVVACLTALFILSLIAASTSLVCILVRHDLAAKNLLVGAMAASAMIWFITMLLRRKVLCPLCKGTPLLNNNAIVHSRAWRLWPLNHGFTAIISIIVSQKFRCIYCGSDFDLLKPRAQLSNPAETNESSLDTP